MEIIKKLAPAVLTISSAVSIITFDVQAVSPDTPYPIAWQQGEKSGAELQRSAYIPETESWCHYPWNRGTETGNTVGKAGCSLFSVINGVYYRTGNFISPVFLADYTLEKGYRTEGYSGVKVEFFEEFALEYGDEYGMTYAGNTDSAEETLAHVRAGGVSSSNIYGHWVTIADYDAENDLYLMLDSSQLSTRCDNIEWTDRQNGVAWLSADTFLEEGKSGYFGIDGRYSALYNFDYTFSAEHCDADGSGSVDLGDSSAVLGFYAKGSAGYENPKLHPHPIQNDVCIEAADADSNSVIDIDDAKEILSKYAETASSNGDAEQQSDFIE